MKKIFMPLMILMIIISFMGIVKVDAATNFEPLRKLDAGLMLREEKSDLNFLEASKEQIAISASEIDFDTSSTLVSAQSSSNFTYNGGSKYFLGYNLEFILFTLRSVGENVEIWVANDLSYGYNNPYGPDVVTQQQVDQLRDEFETNIYPTTTGFFGDEQDHDGSYSVLEAWGYVPSGYYYSSQGKKVILVENIKDESYYQNVPFYVAGFYWGALEYYIDRNIITIDSYAWFALMPNDNPRYQAYQYDVFGTVAHEFQHLIHADNDPYEEKWINEGMSDFSQYLCGYGHNYSHISWFLDQPENSLLLWGDYDGTEILADYGQAYLLQLYLSEQFGQEFIRSLATNTMQGIDSLNYVLKEFNTKIDFYELFRRFTIAVAIDTKAIGNGIYNFESIDLRVNYESAELYEKDGVPAWGANYKVIQENSKIQDIVFSVQDYLPMAWEVAYGEYFWSNNGHGVDNFLIFEADLSNLSTATLTIDHIYDIEESWDFGFVQVSIDDGLTWITLENENTRSDFLNWGEYPDIGFQLPGFTGYRGYQTDDFDLTPFAGQKIHIAFRYMTDGAENAQGWFIDNIAIDELGYYNDCTSLDGFIDLSRLQKNYLKYHITFINEKVLPNGKKAYKLVEVENFDISKKTPLELRQLFKDGTNYMIAWHASENNSTVSVAFDYEIILKK